MMKSRGYEFLKIKSTISKHIIASVALVISSLGFSQSNVESKVAVMKTAKLENVFVTVNVDAADDIKSMFTLADIKAILESSDENELLSFKLICNGEYMPNGNKSSLIYEVKGNSNDAKGFLKSIKKIRASALKYYKNKN